MKVLLADDDKSMRLFLTRSMEKRGFDIVACSTGDEAWDLYTKDKYSLVLLDWNMPGKSGAEVCERIKHNLADGFVYVILITSKHDDNDIVEGLDRGADDYIKKPVIIAELNARINSAIRVIEYEEKIRLKEEESRYSCYSTLSELAEKRDHETLSHMKRIGLYSSLLAKKMGQSDEFCHEMELFAPMHDIGKVGIPDGILNIPRSLYNEEYELIKLHTKLGWQILCGKVTLDTAAIIAYTHHEHWDGSGYPRHLKKEEIPLEGRICAVADCYDSLRAVKPYSPAYTHVEAVKKVIEYSETLYDPNVVKALVAVQSEMEQIFDENYISPIRLKP